VVSATWDLGVVGGTRGEAIDLSRHFPQSMPCGQGLIKAFFARPRV
jgi:hypothetical protein